MWGADAPSYKQGPRAAREVGARRSTRTRSRSSVEAARNALARAEIDPQDIGAIYVGSESHPYAVKPSGTTVAEAIGATPDCHCADFEFACKAGTEGMFVAYGLVKAGLIKYGLGIGADTSQGAPGDALEYSAAAGAAAFIFGADETSSSPTIDETYSFMTDTPDFWRREHQFYPSHAGRFTGEPAYFRTVTGAVNGILEKSGHEAGGLQVRRLPPAERQVPAARRQDARLHEGADRDRAGSCRGSATPTRAPRRSA